MRQVRVDQIVMVLTALLLFLEAWYTWRRVPITGRIFLALTLASAGLGALFAALLFASTTESDVLRYAALWEAAGTPMVAVFFFLFAVRFAGVRRLAGPWLAAVLIAAAAVFTVAVAVRPDLVYLPGHGLGPLSFTNESVGVANGPTFWPQNAVYWAFIGGGLLLFLAEVVRTWRLQRLQALVGLCGVGIILGIQVSVVAGLVLLPGIHVGVLALALGTLPIILSLPRLRATDLRLASQKRILGVMSDAVFLIDLDGWVEGVNQAAADMLVAMGPAQAGPHHVSGYPVLEALAMRDDRESDGDADSERLTAIDLHGETHYLDARRTRIGRGGNASGQVLVVRDVTGQMQTALALRESAERLSILFEQSPTGVLVFDTAMVGREVNERFARLVGTTVELLKNAKLSYENVSNLLGACREALGGTSSAYSGPIVTSAGVERWLECEVSPLRAEDGSISGAVCMAWDVTGSKRSEDLIDRLSFSDTLTGLPNRALFRDRLRTTLPGAARSGTTPLVAVIDLDRFTAVNEALGHAAADRLIQAVGSRLVAAFREEDTVARWGGDEFAVLMPGLGAQNDVYEISTRISGCFRDPWLIGDAKVWLTASAGLALYPTDGSDAPTLLEHAETASQDAKRQGGDCSRFYAIDMDTDSRQRLALASDLHHALEHEELVLHYQPQIVGEARLLVGCEALVRWAHPARGLVPPDEFIPLAEESGLIVPIGEWVLRTACAQAASWSREYGVRLRVAVNLSARQFRQRDLATVVAGALADACLPASQLELEVTETAIMADPQGAAAMLAEIAELGVTVALDDLGTGYSSLAHLCELPIDRIKIDRSFVGRLPEAADAAAITRAVIDMARNLGITVIAEGVETEEQVDFLRTHGCEDLQGYYFGKPVPPSDFECGEAFIAAITQTSGVLALRRGAGAANASRRPDADLEQPARR